MRGALSWLLLVACVGVVAAQGPVPAADTSPHTIRFVNVGNGVRLEVLDWSGAGIPVVLLAGGGDTAHVFDGFAPKLAPNLHVYGITRRGFGASTFSSNEVGPDRLADDVLTVLDYLRLSKPVLVGHSIAGREMSSIASRHPERVSALVYLEAGYPYAFDNGTGPTMQDFQSLTAPQPPPPSDRELATFGSLRDYYMRVLGFSFPDAELRQQRTTGADGRVGGRREFPGSQTLLTGMQKYADIRVPSLWIYALPHSQGRWIDHVTDPKVRERARAYDRALTALTERQAKSVETGLPSARVVRLNGAHHYIYLSNEADVLRETRSFMSRLPH